MNIETIIIIALTVLLIVAGGYIKKLTQEIKELVLVFQAAIEDSEVSSEELAQIIKEARDVKDTILSILQLIATKRCHNVFLPPT